MQGLKKRVSSNSLTKALMGKEDANDDDSDASAKQVSQNESMFGNDVNKKSRKPVRGYRWMFFTFTMIIVLCLMVFFHDKVEKQMNKMKDGATQYFAHCGEQTLAIKDSDKAILFEATAMGGDHYVNADNLSNDYFTSDQAFVGCPLKFEIVDTSHNALVDKSQIEVLKLESGDGKVTWKIQVHQDKYQADSTLDFLLKASTTKRKEDQGQLEVFKKVQIRQKATEPEEPIVLPDPDADNGDEVDENAGDGEKTGDVVDENAGDVVDENAGDVVDENAGNGEKTGDVVDKNAGDVVDKNADDNGVPVQN